jgi:uncharacterized membrane protein YhaH (DUF805 family)
MNWVYLFNSAHGRIARQPFLIACAALTAAEMVGQWLAYQIEGDRLGIIVDLAFTYPEFMLAVKRANDRNLSTWILVAFFTIAVLINFFMLMGWNGLADDQNPVFNLIVYGWAIFAVVLIVELALRRGTVGDNRFGPDPLAAKP